jgi:tRNA G18 (ribose-2'-O)-methylase SpoU
MTYARNVASLFRIADALGAKEVYLTGESHRPPFGKDLAKVSRGKENKVPWQYAQETQTVVEKVKKEGFQVIAVEQCAESVLFTEYTYPSKIALLVGSEMFGLSKKSAALADAAVVIPMYGKGGSLNVHVALSIVAFFASAQKTPTPS